MKIKINEIFLPVKHSQSDIINAILKRLQLNRKSILSYKIAKKSIDARKKHDIKYVYSINVTLDKNYPIKDNKTSLVSDFEYFIPKCKNLKNRPIVIGFGPAGMFASLILAQSGQKPIVIERGSCVEDRLLKTETFFKKAILDIESNVQFGEGGAGTFSDGKLNTGTKDKRIKKVLTEFVVAGAPEEILYDTKPHIGTDKLPDVVKNIRKTIISLGGEVYFDTKMSNLEIKNGCVHSVKTLSKSGERNFESDNVILAIGHSARDSFKMLSELNIAMEQKAFSLGLRIEHPLEMINKSQYGNFHKDLPSADYKLFKHLTNGRGVYTFCMCPGGEVVGASSEENAVVTNGMSRYARNDRNSNSAVLVNINTSDFKSTDILSGIHLQQEIEQKAFKMAGSNYNAPCQRFEDFLNHRASKNFGDVTPSYQPGVSFCDINKLLPDYISQSIAQGIKEFSKNLAGFDMADAVLTAPETRSSSPIRILRGENMNSLSVKGLYPCGEGAGFAGGITSAAVDGIRCAEAVLNSVNNDI